MDQDKKVKRCLFCEEYARRKVILKEYKKNNIVKKIKCSMVAVSYLKGFSKRQSTITYERRDLKYCPCCGIKFNSPEYRKFYKEYMKGGRE